MDKYMIKANSSQSVDLLQALRERSHTGTCPSSSSAAESSSIPISKRKRSSELNDGHDKESSKENRVIPHVSAGSVKLDSWDEYRDHSTSNTQIVIKPKSSSLTGWRQVDGKKVYKTYRNGELVRNTGQDAFFAYLADDRTRGKKSKHK
jgi:hypothetical protein